jgi:hypothetical protein
MIHLRLFSELRRQPRRSFFMLLLLASLLIHPRSSSAHALEYLVAKLSLLPAGRVRLEITADYALNPLIPDADAAVKALEDPLHVLTGTQQLSLDQLTKPSFELHENWSRCAPARCHPQPPHRRVGVAA